MGTRKGHVLTRGRHGGAFGHAGGDKKDDAEEELKISCQCKSDEVRRNTWIPMDSRNQSRRERDPSTPVGDRIDEVMLPKI